MNRRFALLLLPVLLVGAGCTTAGAGQASAPTASPPPFADCVALTAPPGSAGHPTGSAGDPTGAGAARAGSADAPTGPASEAAAGRTAPAEGTAGAPPPLPDLGLPCFTGGETIALRSLRGPAVINLWASWCDPCRKELPALQRLADRAGGRLHVVGVNTRDDRAVAQDLATDFGLTFPSLSDPGERLRLALRRNVLPMTLFVDSEGRVRYLYDSTALDDAKLTELVARHLGVAVPS